MPLPRKQMYTIDDIYNLPDGQRAELIDGKMYMMAPPSTMHQRILSQLLYSIADHIKKTNGSCEVFPAPFAVFLNEDDAKYLEPDISVICDPNKIDDKGCHGAPDWIIEITSPSNSGHDYVLKLNKYMAAGVREYWIVNPAKTAITVYDFTDENFIPQLYTFSDKIKVNIYDNLYIDFSELDI